MVLVKLRHYSLCMLCDKQQEVSWSFMGWVLINLVSLSKCEVFCFVSLGWVQTSTWVNPGPNTKCNALARQPISFHPLLPHLSGSVRQWVAQWEFLIPHCSPAARIASLNGRAEGWEPTPEGEVMAYGRASHVTLRTSSALKTLNHAVLPLPCGVELQRITFL
jgi:hypothetical protein